jgi:hypothetical protein
MLEVELQNPGTRGASQMRMRDVIIGMVVILVLFAVAALRDNFSPAARTVEQAMQGSE